MNIDCISVTRDIIIGLSALTVAIVAIFGLSTWRKELTGKAKFEIARNLMLLAYKIRANFEWVRNPDGWSWEYTDRIKQEDETPEISHVLNQWYLKSKRLKPLHEHLQRFQEASWEAEIVLGEESKEDVSEVLSAYLSSFGELSSAIFSYFDIERDKAAGHDISAHADWLKELRKDIYSVKDDDFSKRIDEATNKLASELKNYVK